MTLSSRRPRPSWVPLSLVLPLGTGCLALVGLRWSGVAEAAWPGYLGLCLAAALAAVSAGFAVRRAAGRARGAWLGFGCAALAWVAGAVIRSIFGPLLGHPAAPSSLADLFSLVAAAALVVSFALAAPRPPGARAWGRLLLDVWIAAGSVFGLVWVALLAPLYRDAELSPSSLLLDLSYPLVDIVAFCLVAAFLLRTRPRVRRTVRTAFLAVVAVTVADVAYAVSLLGGAYDGGGPIPLAWAVGYLLLAAAPWIDPLDDTSEDGEPHDLAPGGVVPARAFLPIAAGALAVVTLVVTALVPGTGRIEAGPLLLVIGASVAVALLARSAWLLADNVRLNRQLDTAEQRFRSVVRSEGGVVLIIDVDGRVHYVSGDGGRLYGYAAADVEGSMLGDFIHPEDLPEVRSRVNSFVTGGSLGGSVRMDSRVRAADGTWHHLQATIGWHVPEQERLIVIAKDVTDQVTLREHLDHLTFHDGLTGLPNRAYFEARTREVLARRGGGVAVLFLDLDGFTAVNDSVGHASGDRVLGQAARRLRSEVAADDTVARFGGDEFAVLTKTREGAQVVVDLAERLIRALSEPFHVAGREIALTASVGIVFGARTGHPEVTPDLLRNADVAMSRARQRGGSRVELFAASMHADVMRRLEVGTKLRQAINSAEFVIEYQPVVDLRTSHVTGVEALVRWWRDGALVPPEGFIQHAEQSGLIVPIGEWVLREACREMARWRDADWDVGLCVNFSERQITEPRFIETVAEALDQSGLSPGALTLEVTEGVLTAGHDGTVQRLRELRNLGVRLAIDDFGTGYASLAYLRQLPVDTLKIDRSFVAGLGNDEVLALLTRTVVRLGQDLGLLVVAEGIERPDQLELLREMGCPRGQGYLVARPMAARGVESLLRTGFSPPTGRTVGMPHGSVLPAH